MSTPHPDTKRILDRISRIEGQVRGLRKMVEEQRGCPEVIKQVAATAGALRSLGMVILEHHLHDCVESAAAGRISRNELIKRLVELFNRVGA